jgi:cellulose synthase/poly-beta-1,6-N-acetylglucosamine synthase-like glycosyltransferase
VLAAAFWTLAILGVYPYVLYPVLLAVFSVVRRKDVRKDDSYVPTVTVIIAAFNEVKHIEATVRNKLAQDYPRDRLNVIVVSDGSEDGTDAVVERLAREDSRVRLIRQEPRQGKTSGLNLAMPAATGEVVVFSDANSIYRPDALRLLARNFSDPQVGYVTGLMLYVNPDGSLVGDGCSAYMRYENWLRAAETRVGSIVGVDGGVDAVRRSLYVPMRADQLPDFVLPLNVVGQGYRVVFEPKAVLNEDTLTSSSAEYRMRVRVALRALWALWDQRYLLNPLRHPFFGWQLASHKVLRYLSFIPLAGAAVINWMLLSSGLIYQVAAAGQVVFLVAVLLAMYGPKSLAGSALPRYCYYFLLLNWTSAVAFVRFLRGHKQVLWQPRMG